MGEGGNVRAQECMGVGVDALGRSILMLRIIYLLDWGQQGIQRDQVSNLVISPFSSGISKASRMANRQTAGEGLFRAMRESGRQAATE
jgi:hypothetical protein